MKSERWAFEPSSGKVTGGGGWRVNCEKKKTWRLTRRVQLSKKLLIEKYAASAPSEPHLHQTYINLSASGCLSKYGAPSHLVKLSILVRSSDLEKQLSCSGRDAAVFSLVEKDKKIKGSFMGRG